MAAKIASFFLLTRFSIMRSVAEVSRIFMQGLQPQAGGHTLLGASAMPTATLEFPFTVQALVSSG
jgi:hypothetical protein